MQLASGMLLCYKTLMDYIETLQASRRKKKRIIALRASGHKPAQIAERIGCSRQYIEQVYKDYQKSLKSNKDSSRNNDVKG